MESTGEGLGFGIRNPFRFGLRALCVSVVKIRRPENKNAEEVSLSRVLRSCEDYFLASALMFSTGIRMP